MPPPGTLGAAVQFAVENYCSMSASIIAARRVLGTSDGTGGGGNLDEVFHNFLCPAPPPPPGTPIPDFDPPFTGGQCQKDYNVQVTVRAQQGDRPPEVGSTGAILRGAISAIFVRRPSEFSYQVICRHGVAGNPGATVESVLAGGTFSESPNSAVITATSTTPLDGVDNCGDRPPEIPPYGDDYYNRPFNFNVDVGGNSVSVGGSITVNSISPSVNFNGDLSIPIAINFDDGTQLDFDLDINGDANYTGGNPSAPPSPNVPNAPSLPGGGGGGGSCTPFTPDDGIPDPDSPPPPVGDGDTPEPVPPASQAVIRGVLVVSTPVGFGGAETEIFQEGGNPNVFAPSIGLVSFAIQVGSTYGWTADIPVKNRRQFIPCPWEGGAIDVKGTPNLGWNHSLTPVIIQEEVPSPAGSSQGG